MIICIHRQPCIRSIFVQPCYGVLVASCQAQLVRWGRRILGGRAWNWGPYYGDQLWRTSHVEFQGTRHTHTCLPTVDIGPSAKSPGSWLGCRLLKIPSSTWVEHHLLTWLQWRDVKRVKRTVPKMIPTMIDMARTGVAVIGIVNIT